MTVKETIAEYFQMCYGGVPRNREQATQLEQAFLSGIHAAACETAKGGNDALIEFEKQAVARLKEMGKIP